MVAQSLKLFLVVIAVLQVVSRANTGEFCVLVLPLIQLSLRARSFGGGAVYTIQASVYVFACT